MGWTLSFASGALTALAAAMLITGGLDSAGRETVAIVAVTASLSMLMPLVYRTALREVLAGVTGVALGSAAGLVATASSSDSNNDYVLVWGGIGFAVLLPIGLAVALCARSALQASRQ